MHDPYPKAGSHVIRVLRYIPPLHKMTFKILVSSPKADVIESKETHLVILIGTVR